MKLPFSFLTFSVTQNDDTDAARGHGLMAILPNY
jgi:hypothetical protein